MRDMSGTLVHKSDSTSQNLWKFGFKNQHENHRVPKVKQHHCFTLLFPANPELQFYKNLINMMESTNVLCMYILYKVIQGQRLLLADKSQLAFSHVVLSFEY